MLNSFVSTFSELIVIGLAGAFLSNAVLCRAMGLDRVKTIEEDSDEVIFFILQCACSVLTSLLFWLTKGIVGIPASLLDGMGISEYYARAFLWPLLIAIITAGVFFLVFVITVKVAPYDKVTSAARQLPFAAFNTFVAGTVLISASAEYSFFETLLYTIGANIGFIIANWMLREGNRKLQNREIPAAFRGFPSRLLYLAGLAIAFYALTGRSLSSLL
ncbi:MAG: hypothetical protein IKD87_03285 [Oscillospiraceae bacterium]|nr:hypothetical protein [Oscillospiraceae bacterium]MBR2739674.1 hypothetical protein [Oscillospiraceae bacterium]MBR3126175.1 hypothetical protein [Mogibacterium sp.]